MTHLCALKDIQNFCEQQLRSFAPKQLILLEGDLGYGKTTLVQKCAQILNHDKADSPTFSIINEYPTQPKMFHVDLYRLDSSEDIDSTGFWDLFSENRAIIFVEWSNKIPDATWPKSWSPKKWIIEKQNTDATVRKITVQNLV